MGCGSQAGLKVLAWNHQRTCDQHALTQRRAGWPGSFGLICSVPGPTVVFPSAVKCPPLRGAAWSECPFCVADIGFSVMGSSLVSQLGSAQ